MFRQSSLGDRLNLLSIKPSSFLSKVSLRKHIKLWNLLFLSSICWSMNNGSWFCRMCRWFEVMFTLTRLLSEADLQWLSFSSYFWAWVVASVMLYVWRFIISFISRLRLIGLCFFGSSFFVLQVCFLFNRWWWLTFF